MQTVNFHCGHCGQLMAVGADHLGQQVRCPHCTQVVTAPAASAESPAAEPPVPEHESIFGTPDSVGEDLFGTVPAPTIEMPDPAAPWYSDREERGAEKPSGQSNGPVTSASPGTPTSVPARTVAEPNVAPPPDPTLELSGLTQPASAQRSLDPASHAPERANIGLLVLLIFLVPYAVCATAAAIYFYFQKVNTPHPLEAIPDFIGDKPGATRKNGHADIILERPSPDMDLPNRDHVALHQTLTIGDLEVTPEKVERGHITIYRPLISGQEKIALREGLLLTLRVRNISEDDFFCPADAYFYRRWQTNDPPANRPYTRLRIGDKVFYGGPVSWVPSQRDASRYFVEGEENFTDDLKPGQTEQLVICTDPENQAILGALKQPADSLEWRVQLRRGLIRFKGRDIPTSAVVAVDFSPQDIQ